MSDPDTGATVRAWTDVVRRAQFDKVIVGTHAGRFIKGSTVKAVALTLASYADSNGTRVFPGVARLAADLEIGYRVAGRCVVGLRELGLIELVRRAVRRGARSERDRTDEYRLTLPEDLFERLTVPTPSDFRSIVAAVARPHRHVSEARSDPAVLTAHSARLDSPIEPESNRVIGTPGGESNRVFGTNLTASQVPATIDTDLPTKETVHSEIALDSKAAATRGREAGEDDQNFEEGVPSLRVVTGGGVDTNRPRQRGLWPALVPEAAPMERQQAITEIRRILSNRPRRNTA
jgi:hypothetical protein